MTTTIPTVEHLRKVALAAEEVERRAHSVYWSAAMAYEDNLSRGSVNDDVALASRMARAHKGWSAARHAAAMAHAAYLSALRERGA